MSKEELIKKLLPSSVNLNPRIGGKIEISWEDISGCLSCLPGHVSDYARLKYDVDSNSRNYFKTLLCLKLLAEKLPAIEHLPVAKFNKLVEMVLRQEIKSNICTTCRGTKSRRINSKVVECFTCKGTGRIKYTQERCAAFIGVCERTYVRNWKNHANHVYNILSDWDYQINRILCKKTRE